MALNKLTDAVKDRQKALGSPDQVNRQLQQLQQLGKDGPAGEFMKDLAKGDFDKAAGDLKKLQEKLASGKMTEQEKKALKAQLGELSKQLKQAANMEQRKQQLEQARKNGGLSQKQFEQEMAKLNEQKKSLENLQKLANQLANAEKQMTAGDLKKAAEQLGLSQKQMEEMAQQMQEIQSLDSALAELQDAKDGMNGADMPNSFGDSLGQFGSNRRRNNGNGMGRGRGQGDRPEAEDDVRFYGTKTPSQLMKGKAVAEGFAPPSTQKKGQSLVSVQGEIETSSGSSADALTNQKVPKSVEKHVQGYFDLINKGQQ
jgi:myosin heavy subunit